MGSFDDIIEAATLLLNAPREMENFYATAREIMQHGVQGRYLLPETHSRVREVEDDEQSLDYDSGSDIDDDICPADVKCFMDNVDDRVVSMTLGIWIYCF